MVRRSTHFARILLGLCLFMIYSPLSLSAQQKPKSSPPASVTVAEVKTGMVAPQSEFIATIFYQEISETASEISGLASDVRFEEGLRVKKGQILVKLGADILRKQLQAANDG